jgi:transcriptional regulator with XRE-family HTH domain
MFQYEIVCHSVTYRIMKKRAIAHAREALGKTQEQFARYCGESLSVIRFREYGRRKVPLALASKLANEYGFSEQSLLVNKPGPSLMFDGKPATAAVVKGWANLQPDMRVANELSKRAGRIVEGLILQAAAVGGKEYRRALRDLSLWIDNFGKREPLQTCKRVTFPQMTLDELRTEYLAIWRNITGWPGFRKTRLFGGAMVEITVEIRDIASPLLGAFEDDGKGRVAEIPYMVEKKIIIHSCSKKLGSFTCTDGSLEGITPDR